MFLFRAFIHKYTRFVPKCTTLVDRYLRNYFHLFIKVVLNLFVFSDTSYCNRKILNIIFTSKIKLTIILSFVIFLILSLTLTPAALIISNDAIFIAFSGTPDKLDEKKNFFHRHVKTINIITIKFYPLI